MEAGLSGAAAEKIDLEDCSVCLHPVSERPAELIDALIVFFTQQQDVQRAYLVELIDLASGLHTSCLIGIELLSDEDLVIAGTATIIRDIHGCNHPVDILELGSGKRSTISSGLQESDCFYDRSWGAHFVDQEPDRPS